MALYRCGGGRQLTYTYNTLTDTQKLNGYNAKTYTINCPAGIAAIALSGKTSHERYTNNMYVAVTSTGTAIQAMTTYDEYGADVSEQLYGTCIYKSDSAFTVTVTYGSRNLGDDVTKYLYCKTLFVS